jgi:hypothetical protein
MNVLAMYDLPCVMHVIFLTDYYYFLSVVWWQPPIAAVHRKKGATNTPSTFQFFEKETGGSDIIQNRR